MYRAPTRYELEESEYFRAIWSVIRHWDIARDRGDGNRIMTCVVKEDACAILDAINSVPKNVTPLTNQFESIEPGDRVWSWRKGWGTVDSVLEKEKEAPIVVKFDKSWNVSRFFLCGRRVKGEEMPELFWDKIHIDPPPPPRRYTTRSGWAAPVVHKYASHPCFIERDTGKLVVYDSYSDAKDHQKMYAAQVNLDHSSFPEPQYMEWTIKE